MSDGVSDAQSFIVPVGLFFAFGLSIFGYLIKRSLTQIDENITKLWAHIEECREHRYRLDNRISLTEQKISHLED